MIYNNGRVLRGRDDAAPPRPPKGPERPAGGNNAADDPEPFDPDELSRRLCRVLADQRAETERRRRARPEAEKPRPREPPPRAADAAGRPGLKLKHSRLSRLVSQRRPPGPDAPTRPPGGAAGHAAYVPRQAAAQFARTATAAGMRDGPAAGPGGAARRPPPQPALLLHLHGQPQRMAALQEAAEAEARERDRRREQREQGRHTFAGEMEQLLGAPAAGKKEAPRRASLGGIVEVEDRDGSDAGLEGADEPAGAPEPQEHARVDWTQSDEPPPPAAAAATQEDGPGRPPLLKRADSLWALRGRLGGASRHGRAGEREGPAAPGGGDPAAPLKSPRAGFFSRFRR